MRAQWVWTAVAVLGAAMTASGAAQASAAGSESGSAAAQAGRASASAAQATGVSAELTKSIDSKNAKVGDQVFAKTTSEARLADGTRLPKGSKLLGHVTEVEPHSKQNRDSHLAFCFDHAVLKDGHEVPLNAMVHAIAAPAPITPPSDSDMMPGGGMQGGGMQGDARTGGGGGLAGNGPSPIRGATNVAGGAAATATGGLNGAASGIDGTADGAAGTNGALGSAANLGANATAMNRAAGADGALGAGAALPVRNLSGVTFSTVNLAAGGDNGGANASGGAAFGTMLTGHNKNVSLEGGSQMMVAVAPR